MSHRVTVKTEIKDQDIAKKALTNAGYTYNVNGNSLFITSGKLKNVTINTVTGEVFGDTDYGHREDNLGLLRQAYARETFLSELQKQGGTVESETMNSQGEIVLMYSIG